MAPVGEGAPPYGLSLLMEKEVTLFPQVCLPPYLVICLTSTLATNLSSHLSMTPTRWLFLPMFSSRVTPVLTKHRLSVLSPEVDHGLTAPMSRSMTVL